MWERSSLDMGHFSLLVIKRSSINGDTLGTGINILIRFRINGPTK